MSDTPDVPASPKAPSGLRAVNARGPLIELVTSTGSREIAVLMYRSVPAIQTAAPAVPDADPSRVYGIAVRMLRSPTLALEAGLDSELEVWRTASGFDADRSSALAWIMALAHRRAMDRMRTGPEATRPPPTVPVTPQGRRAARDARRQDRATSSEASQVREALARLNPEQCAALELAYYDGHTGVEPADLDVILTTLVNRALPQESIRHDATEPSDLKGSRPYATTEETRPTA